MAAACMHPALVKMEAGYTALPHWGCNTTLQHPELVVW